MQGLVNNVGTYIRLKNVSFVEVKLSINSRGKLKPKKLKNNPGTSEPGLKMLKNHWSF